MSEALRILVLCSGNSCRSQMAEAWFKHLASGRVQAFSGGSNPAGAVHPLAIRVMDEVGLNLRSHRSKSMNEFLGQAFDVVITVCDEAAEACPVFPGKAVRLHWPFDDPARATGDETARLAVFRCVREEIRLRIEGYLASMG